MKSILTALVSFVLSLSAIAQLSDDDARRIFADAERAYEAGNFYEAFRLCTELNRKAGKSTPRVLYLQMRAAYNNLEKKDDKSSFRLHKSYRQYSRMNGLADQFFALADKKTYPPDKYSEIDSIARYFREGLTRHAGEKDRTPADAIRFLNETAEILKITGKDDNKFSEPKGDGYMEIKFSLEGSFLVIDMFGELKDFKEKSNSQAARKRLRINLSKVWISDTDSFKVYLSGYYFGYSLRFLNEFGNYKHLNKELEFFINYRGRDFLFNFLNAPLIKGPEIFIDGRSQTDAIQWYSDFINQKKPAYPPDQFEAKLKANGYNMHAPPVFIYSFFDHQSKKYYDENYGQRIRDAFEFLMEYYGGGEPVGKNADAPKSKF